MNENKQLDVSRALAVAGVFHFLHCAAKSCVMPFLTIYFRHLGLTPPLVGIIMGMKHLISVVWAPLCSYLAKSHRRRRILLCASLLSSVGAGLLLTLISPLHREMVYRLCNISLNSGDKLISTGTWAMKDISNENFSQHMALTTVPEKVHSNPTTQITTSRIKSPAVNTSVPSSLEWIKHITNTSRGRTLKNNTRNISIELETTLEAGDKMSKDNSDMRGLEPLLGEGIDFHSPGVENSSLHSIFNNSEEEVFSGDGHQNLSSPRIAPVLESPPNSSQHVKVARNVAFETLQGTSFFNLEHKTFLMVFGAVVLWELFASPLEWTADDSLYEYLDFVDATDRHGKLWIWGYLGTSVGACSIAALVDNLSCFLSSNIPRMVVHFYGYSVLITASLLVSIFYPIHVSKKTEHANKTVKALGLIGNDGRMLLMAVTVFLTGAVVSTANNFLFWQMQDIGSSELYMGVSIAVALFAEIFLFAFKNRVFKVFSINWTVAISLSCLAIQLVYYSFLWTSWAVLPIQSLSAFSSGALWWLVNSLADDVATPGTERSLQMVLHGLSYGCGASLGSFASGFIVSSFSLAILYRASSIALMLWLALFLIVQSKLPRQRKINYSRLLAADTSDLSDSDEDQERDWLVKAMKDESATKKR